MESYFVWRVPSLFLWKDIISIVPNIHYKGKGLENTQQQYLQEPQTQCPIHHHPLPQAPCSVRASCSSCCSRGPRWMRPCDIAPWLFNSFTLGTWWFNQLEVRFEHWTYSRFNDQISIFLGGCFIIDNGGVNHQTVGKMDEPTLGTYLGKCWNLFERTGSRVI